jgi:hypothetical protein
MKMKATLVSVLSLAIVVTVNSKSSDSSSSSGTSPGSSNYPGDLTMRQKYEARLSLGQSLQEFSHIFAVDDSLAEGPMSDGLFAGGDQNELAVR